MSDLIRREDAARIAEDHNLDIWEYSTGNRSRIGHDPVAEAIRALPAVQPDDDKLVWNMTKLIAAGLDRVLALTAERDRLRALLGEADRRIAWEAHGFGNDFADQVQSALKGESHE